jgi:ribosomal-protein-alanine N-acetyltransferase
MTPAQMAELHARVFTLPRPWTKPEFDTLLASPLVFCLAQPEGFILGRVVADEAEMLTLAVNPDHWGQGFGGRLVDGFLDTVRARASESAFLEVAAQNLRAQGLYARKGFLQAGRRKDYYRSKTGVAQDALVLVWRQKYQELPNT